MKIGFYHQGYLKGTLHHYTMKIVFFIIRLLKGNTPSLQNEDLFLLSSYLKGTLHYYKMKIGFYHQIHQVA